LVNGGRKIEEDRWTRIVAISRDGRVSWDIEHVGIS